jgi:nuclear pore complex protein Nup210
MQLNLTPSSNHSVITIGGNTGTRKLLVFMNKRPLPLAVCSEAHPDTDVELFWNAKDLLSVSRADTNEYKGLSSQIVYRVSHSYQCLFKQL